MALWRDSSPQLHKIYDTVLITSSCRALSHCCACVHSDVSFVQSTGHTSKVEYVEISPQVGCMLRFNGDKPKNKDYLFMLRSRNHTADKDYELSTQAIRTIVKKAMKAIGFDDSRHTAAMLML